MEQKVKKIYPRRPLGQCIKCLIRKARYAEGTCEKCRSLIRAEGIKQEGLLEGHRERSLALRKQRVKQFNRFAKQGLSLRRIAAKWGLSAQFLVHYMAKSREMGFKVPFTNGKKTPQPPKLVLKKPNGGKQNDHGEGWGVKGCNCELCLIARRIKKRAWQAARRIERRQQQQG